MRPLNMLFLSILLLAPCFNAAVHASEMPDSALYAQKQIERNACKEAIQFLSNEIRRHPSDMQLRKLIATAFIKTGLSLKAAEQLQYVCNSKDATAQDLVMLGDAYRFSGNHRKAIETYNKACQIRPDLAKAYAGLIDATALSGDTVTAKRIYRQSLLLVNDAAGKQELASTMRKIESSQQLANSSGTQYKG